MIRRDRESGARKKVEMAPDKVVCGQAEKCRAPGPDSRGQKGTRGGEESPVQP